MDVVTGFPKGDKPGRRGTWWPLGTSQGESATLCCPTCGLVGTLTDHEIRSDGRVTPSVQCPSSSCSFHEMAFLEGWEMHLAEIRRHR